MVGNLIFDQVAYFHVKSLFKLFVFFHLLLNEGNCFSRNITTIIIKALKLSQKWKYGVANTATELVIISSLLFELKVFFEEGYFGHFSLEIGSIFEEIAFMEFIEFIPYLIAAIGHFLIFLFLDVCVIFGQLFLCLVNHIRRKLVEDDVLFGSSILIEFELSPFFLLIGLHC